MASSSSSSSGPTCRSRTLLFLSYRDSRAQPTRFHRSRGTAANSLYDDADDEQQGLLMSKHQPGGHIALDVDSSLPPAWVDFSDQVEQILADTQSKIQSLEKLHAKHVLPGFADRTQEEREIESVTTEITKDFRRCQSLIQRIGATPAAQHKFPPSTADSRNHEALAAKNVQRGLAAKVQDMSAAFRKKQRVYMEKLQGHAIKNQDLLIASGTISLKGSEGLSAVDDDIAAASHTQNQSQALALAHADPSLDTDMIQTRDRELTEIARSISSLAELFKDLSGLVIDQGTLLDSIEYNIEQTAVEMKEAGRELGVATKYQKKTGRRQCIFLLLLIIFGLIVVLIFKPRRHSSSGGSGSDGYPAVSPVPASGGRVRRGGEAEIWGDEIDAGDAPAFPPFPLPRALKPRTSFTISASSTRERFVRSRIVGRRGVGVRLEEIPP